MTWKIEFGKEAKRDFAKLDKSVQRKIFQYLNVRVAGAPDPKAFGKPLTHNLTGLWRYRVGDYRILCKIEDDTLTVLVVEIGHRSTIYD